MCVLHIVHAWHCVFVSGYFCAILNRILCVGQCVCIYIYTHIYINVSACTAHTQIYLEFLERYPVQHICIFIYTYIHRHIHHIYIYIYIQRYVERENNLYYTSFKQWTIIDDIKDTMHTYILASSIQKCTTMFESYHNVQFAYTENSHSRFQCCLQCSSIPFKGTERLWLV